MFLSFFHIVPWLDKMNQVSYLVIFYICVSVVSLVILDLFYVKYSQQRRKYNFAWPIQSLRTASFLLRTILFIPFLCTNSIPIILFSNFRIDVGVQVR